MYAVLPTYLQVPTLVKPYPTYVRLHLTLRTYLPTYVPIYPAYGALTLYLQVPTLVKPYPTYLHLRPTSRTYLPTYVRACPVYVLTPSLEDSPVKDSETLRLQSQDNSQTYRPLPDPKHVCRNGIFRSTALPTTTLDSSVHCVPEHIGNACPSKLTGTSAGAARPTR